ncbi:S41 family peptidase [Puia dinghuensis]|uniref:Peptidase S41 n=1 Tax=Puia dinghuensis TaxID=1792502 RepID=A0A8J2UB09_9BACT|nr:S41 family peptidase [Puia dinghuensis]GGA91567.1 peptidase S41 [Puia dinghuensis]
MKKLQVWLPLLFAIVMIVGMIIGFRLRGNIRPTGIFVARKPTPVQEVMDLINMNYVDSISPDTIAGDAIEGMLTHLDPHSVYIPAADVTEVNEDLQGNFEGIGVEFQIFDDTVNVVNVLPGGPSDKANLKVGDKFLKVGDSVVAGNGITNDRIRKLLRGPGSSDVAITLLRVGEPGKPMQVHITRGTIPLPSVDVSYMINKETGYIRINRFSETTHAEFAQALMQLQKEGLQKLILDLRGNGGGILQESIEIADDFLDGDKLIVYTVGARSPKVEYRCRRDGLFEKGKLVLLTDEGTASASEVLTGAIQDWDRATIIGRRTFGKGLVQQPFQLSDGSSLRLTIARYYTPTGRSIQKPYDKGHDDYNEEVMKRFHDGEVLHGDTSTKHTGAAYRTLGPERRTVYGGGGITPDIFIGFDTSTFSRNATALYIDGTINRFIYAYYIQHLSTFQPFKTPEAFITGYHDEEALWKGLTTYAAKDTINLTNVGPKEKDELKHRLKAMMARQIWRTEGYYEVSNAYDPVVTKALEVVAK